MPTQTAIRDEVTARIITALEQNLLPWRRPWRTTVGGSQPGRHSNVASKRPYQGVNPLLLELHALRLGLAEQDRREHLEAWAAWANEPIVPHLAVRCIPGFFATCKIPPELTTSEEMERFTQDFAKKQHKKTWLVLSRKLRVYFDEDGSRRGVQEAAPGEIAGPWMRLKASKRKFLFGGSGIVPITEPEKHEPGRG